ncbi:MAG TPA: maltose alpha-D-glucosyltransferase [Sandaracinaceae bacterium LLY-WYZ-13_1]|nr:maltose alpha-D-glucosyltransferase [Sandaracinaceae bacterium LLY-WYZ-13_1]
MPRSNEDESLVLADDPLWFKDAIIYEIAVRAFFDSNDDGIGDFRGLVQKLDYVQDLGVTAIWILPFYPSPLRDGGYDIADYSTVASMYGTKRDFRRFLEQAHKRGIRVITELVINHTSDQHPWFQRARKAKPGSRWRDWYVWTDDPSRYGDTRIIFQDYEPSNWTWDRVAQQYFWHRFYSHQPDLNFDNPEVREAVIGLCDQWLEMGVDGMRLDAIPYLYEREGTNCENLPETHDFLKELRAHIDGRFENRMLLAEANQWPEDAAAYFGEGDECHMNFHFPLMPRMFMSVQLESSFPIHDILAQTPKIPDNCQWAVFLRNHDELTLEMVTDEDRDFMYKVYAEDPQMRVNLGIRRRLAPLLKTRARVELMNALLFSMPGTPVLYYGDEIGMGDNIYLGDRDAVRTPMQWSADRNAGFSKANPQSLYLPTIIDPEYHHTSVNVEAQANNPDSLLWWTKRVIDLRKSHPVFGRGEIELLHPDNGKVLAFFRHDEHERILVVANLSRFSQYVELDLREYAGQVPVELFGSTRFPQIGELPYLLTLGPHGFYWFRIESPDRDREEDGLSHLHTRTKWTGLLEGRAKARIARALGKWMPQRRWFRGKSRVVRGVSIHEVLKAGDARIVLAEVRYRDHDAELYVVPMALAQGERAEQLRWSHPNALIAEVDSHEGHGVLYDASVDEDFADHMLATTIGRGRLRGRKGAVKGRTTKALPEMVDRSLRARQAREKRRKQLPAHLGTAEQSNTSIVFGEAVMLKLFRVLEEGHHPEEELGRYLTERARFEHVPRFGASLTYEPKRGTPRAFGVLQQFVPSQGDAWNSTLDALSRSFNTAWEHVRHGETAPTDDRPIWKRAGREVPEEARAIIGAYLGLARLLGQRTAEMHVALARETEDPDFAPEPFGLLYQRSMYQSARTRLGPAFQSLRKQLKSLPEGTRELAAEMLDRRGEITERMARVHAHKIDAVRTRIHGDFHLGQVLVAGGDFVIIDFEGEPARSLKDRRRKRSPLRDVAGMLRSFDYARASALRGDRVRPDDVASLAPWARAWADWVSAAYLKSWREAAGDAAFVPDDEERFRTLLDFHLLEKCVYEVAYELDNRPHWLAIPLTGLKYLLDAEDA